MNVKFVNPFASSAVEVLREFLFSDISRAPLMLSAFPFPLGQLITIVGLAGELEGQVIIDMDMSTALGIASVMNDRKIDSYEPLVGSTMAELSNIILGRAVTSLCDEGYEFSVAPPSLIIGEKVELSYLSGIETIVIPVLTPFGTVRLSIAVRERETF